MAVPRDKDALLGLIDSTFQKLTAALAEVPNISPANEAWKVTPRERR